MTTFRKTAQQREHGCNFLSRGKSGPGVDRLTSGEMSRLSSSYSYYQRPSPFQGAVTKVLARSRPGGQLGKRSTRDVQATLPPAVAPVPHRQVDPFGIRRLPPGIQVLDRLRLRFSAELKRLHGRSQRAKERRADLKQELDAKLRESGGPFRFCYVRELAFRLIDPHHRWGSGVKRDPNGRRMTASDYRRLIPGYESTYGADVLMTPAFASLIEAAKEFLRQDTASAALPGRPKLSVMALVAKWGFSTEMVALAARRLIITTDVPKAKRKTASIKKYDS